jgi:hypothetical protein
MQSKQTCEQKLLERLRGMKFQLLIIVTILTERLPPSVSCGPNLHYTTEFEAFINEEQEAKQRSYRISISSLGLALSSNRGVDTENISVA